METLKKALESHTALLLWQKSTSLVEVTFRKTRSGRDRKLHTPLLPSLFAPAIAREGTFSALWRICLRGKNGADGIHPLRNQSPLWRETRVQGRGDLGVCLA
jgi:hypothetical protein